jgi:hypothetical protein
MNKKIIIAITSLALALSACGGSSEKTVEPSAKSYHKLRNATNNDALEATIKKLMLETYGKIAPIIMYATDAGGIRSTESSYSTTNTQESSVDEADRLKNDGAYLYVASFRKPSIKVYSVNANGDAKVTDIVRVHTENDAIISGLYLTDNKLIALSGNSHNNYFSREWFNPNYWSDRSTRLDFFEREEGELGNSDNFKVDGQLISSRRIGSTLYLATRHTPTLKKLVLYPENEEQVATNRTLIEAATLSDFLPNYSISGIDKGDVLNPSNCFTTEYPNTSHHQVSVINVIAINLNNTDAKPTGSCFVGNTEALYVSTKSLYLATTQYTYQGENDLAAYNSTINTDIHKFSLNGSEINYKGSAQVAGHLGWRQELKSFRMGEFGTNNDVLGVITYTGDQQSTIASPAKLFILQEDDSQANSLKILAQLPNNKHPEALGKPGEQIYATRFFGSKAYLVTFRTTDPLYILDLSDPADPFVAGELKINGYSDYLHPVGENFVLGIGKDAIPANTGLGDPRGAWYQGVKLSLIDVEDPSDPYERSQLIIGKRGTNTAVSNSHHAFTSLLQTNGDMRIALPISVHFNEELSENDTISTHHQWQYDALFRYDINTVTGTLYQLENIKIPSTPVNDTSQEWQNDRSVIIGDKVYYLHGDDILSRDW